MASILLALEPGPRGVRARVAVTPDRSAHVQDARRSWALGGTREHKKCKPWGAVRVSVLLKVLFDISELEILRDGRSHQRSHAGGTCAAAGASAGGLVASVCLGPARGKGLRECPRKPDF